MDVISHERIGLKVRAFWGQCLAKPLQVALIVLLAEAGFFAIVPALRDARQRSIQRNSRAAGHGSRTGEIDSIPSPLIGLGAAAAACL